MTRGHLKIIDDNMVQQKTHNLGAVDHCVKC